jgi:cytochrome c5
VPVRSPRRTTRCANRARRSRRRDVGVEESELASHPLRARFLLSKLTMCRAFFAHPGFFFVLFLASLNACGTSADSEAPPGSSSDGSTDAGSSLADRASQDAPAREDASVDAARPPDAPSSGDDAAESSDGSMTAVQAIFDERCILCHDATKTGLPSYPALSLTAGDSYRALINKPALETCGATYVVPGQPDQSYIFHKVGDPVPCSGVRMPAPFEIGIMVPLTADQIATIRSWIASGAPR